MVQNEVYILTYWNVVFFQRRCLANLPSLPYLTQYWRAQAPRKCTSSSTAVGQSMFLLLLQDIITRDITSRGAQ